MKKIMNKINMAMIAIMASVPAFADEPKTLDASSFCELFKKLHTVFNILRIAAFIGAAFYIAGWAWEFISKGESKMEEVKKKGIGLLVGFILLFMIGVVLSFALSAAGMKMIGCPTDDMPITW